MKKSFNLNFYLLALLVALSASVSSCKDDEDIITGEGELEIYFDNRANGSALVLGTNYVSGSGDTLNFSMFNYFVSNFELIKADGSVYTVPKDSCYFLVKHSDPSSNTITLKNIPAGDYTGVRFIVGVDSTKSAAPIEERTGVLDPAAGAAGMYWMWNSGYIFVKAEGTSPQAPLDMATNTRRFRYHIGLYGGYSTPTVNNVKTLSLEAHEGDVAEIRMDKTPSMHVEVDIMEMFKTPNPISIAANPTVMVTPFSVNVANNYVDMFHLDHIHN